MAIKLKTKEEIAILREGGHRLATILAEVATQVRPGVSALQLDTIAERLIREGGDEPAFKNYQPSHHHYPYPNSLCVSVNDEVVHGIPAADVILREGDIVSLDLGIKHKGMFTDHAITVPVGNVSKKDMELIHRTREAMLVGIEEAKVGNTVGDIGYAIEQYVKPFKYGIVRDLTGHGVGHAIHEDPFIPNFGKQGKGEPLLAGMVIAIEPMLTLGTYHTIVLDDGYTVVTEDESRACHFEHTVAITDEGPVILTEI